MTVTLAALGTSSPYNPNNQTAITIEDLAPTTLVSTLKDRIAVPLSMPAARQKLTLAGGTTVLKNTASLAFYNLENGEEVVLSVKERGKK